MGLLFPVITFPYVTRVLMAEGIGQVNFFISIIGYVTLITGLGIPIYGVREIARVRDNIVDLSKTTIEILSLNLLLNIVGYIIIFFLCFTIDQIRCNIGLFLLLSASIFLTTIGCNWFYSGIENFKFITIRGVFVRLFSLIILFLLVRSKDDLFYYGLFTIVTNAGSNIINLLWLRHHINIKNINLHDLNIQRHFKPAFAVFMFSIVSSIYLNLDKVMLGFLKDSISVGYYTAASQLSHILLALVISLGTVVLPRSSNLVKNGKFDEFYVITEKSYNFILCLSLPIVTGCIVMAPFLIQVLCGDSFKPSVETLRIISPIIIFIGVSQLIGMQILYPLGKIMLVTLSTCTGAALNLILNFTLIPFFSQNGAAFATVIAEFSVTFTIIILSRKYIKFRLMSTSLFRYLIASLAMATISICFIYNTYFDDYIYFIIVPIIAIPVYFTSLYVLRDRLILESINLLKNTIKEKHG